MWEFQILNQANQDKVGHPKLRSPYMAFALVYDSVTLERQPHALGKSHQPTFWLHTVPHQSCHLVSEVLTGHQPQLLPLDRGFTQSQPSILLWRVTGIDTFNTHSSLALDKHSIHFNCY